MDVVINGIPVIKSLGYIVIALVPAIITAYINSQQPPDVDYGEGWNPSHIDLFWLLSFIWMATWLVVGYTTVTGGW